MPTSSENLQLTLAEDDDFFDPDVYLNGNFKKIDDYISKVPIVEEYVATEGQTTFTLNTPFVVGGGQVKVEIDNVTQSGFTEVNPTTISFEEGLPNGANVRFTLFQNGSSFSGKLNDVATQLAESMNNTVNVPAFKASGISDVQAIRNAVQFAVTNGFRAIDFKSDTYMLNDHLVFGAEVSNMRFFATMATLNTEAIPIKTPTKQTKITFENCENVIFEGFEIVGNITTAQANAGDDVAQIVFQTSTKNCIARNNIVRGKSETEFVHHGIAFYSKNGKAYNNVLKWGDGYGFIVINPLNSGGWTDVYQNTVERFRDHFEPAYTSGNVRFFNNTSLNPIYRHFAIEAKPFATETSGVGIIKNVKIFNNVCSGGQVGVGLGLGVPNTTTKGDYIDGVDVYSNDFQQLTSKMTRLTQRQGNALRNIRYKDNTVTIASTTTEVQHLLEFNASDSDFPVDNVKLINNHIEGESPLVSLVFFYNSGAKTFKNILMDGNTFKNVGVDTGAMKYLIYTDSMEDFTFIRNEFVDKKAVANFKDVRTQMTGSTNAILADNRNLGVIESVDAKYTLRNY